MESYNANQNIDFSKAQEDDPLEILKLKKEHAHVFKLPPMSSAEGHVACDFVELIFKGSMKMTLKGEFMIIYFLNSDNSVFLVSFVDSNVERYVVPVRDSSRYFSIKCINDKGQASWYGVAFKQRNDSFDFKDTLQSFKEKVIFERNLTNQEYKPKYDFSLKNTNTIENTNKSGTSNLIDFGGSSATSKIQPTIQTTSGATSNTTKFNKFKFNMPPSGGK